MRTFYLLLFTIFIYACGNEPAKKTVVPTPQAVQFREEVLKLKEADLLGRIADHELDSLIKKFSSDSMNGLKELLVYSGDMIKLNTELKGRAPHEVYAAVFDSISKHFPDLTASDLKCEYLPETPSDKDTGWILLHAKLGAHSYDKTMYYLNDWPIDELMYKLFNAYLTDIGSDQRLYLVQFSCSDCHTEDDYMGDLDVSNFGLMRLKKEQADSVMNIYDLEMEPVDEFALYSTSRTEEIISGFKNSGIISKEMNAWSDVKLDDVRHGSLYSMEDFFDFFDTLFYTASFDTINDYNPYEDILHQLTRISNGKFNPEGISDQHVTPTLHTIRFSLQGKIYEQEAEQHTRLLDPTIIDRINAALTEQKVKGKFYSVLVRDNIIILVFINDDQLPKVKASGFFKLLEEGAATEMKIKYDAMPPSA